MNDWRDKIPLLEGPNLPILYFTYPSAEPCFFYGYALDFKDLFSRMDKSLGILQ